MDNIEKTVERYETDLMLGLTSSYKTQEVREIVTFYVTRYRTALELIAACQSVTRGDVVDIARQAMR